ncbi:amino acid ABC transporter permease [Leucobacter sp. cx-42]|uniref:amino acid ABC transporter permease n=1 Tax=unclassified Leucobacter TaxID=2621730 RepID=UPI00165D4C1A|nr:amino acid ABC transporter permease [Leucobacter sp. cx-42]
MTSSDHGARPVPSEVEVGRRAFRRKQSVKSLAISILSTIVFAIVVWIALVNSPGWEDVKRSFFDWEIAKASAPEILKGLWLNVQVLFFTSILVAIFGSLLAIARTLKGAVFTPIRLGAALYTDFFRGIPVLLVLYLVGFGLPGLGFVGHLPMQVWGAIALTLTYSSYIAEVLRAGIEAVHPSQRMAARSLGLSHAKTLRLVVMPQAVRKVTPALMNDFVSMQKDVGLISVLGAVDAIRAAQIEVASAYNFTPYVVAGIFFVLLSWPMIRVTDWYTARAQRREQIGGQV